jgi:hypothetical protein
VSRRYRGGLTEASYRQLIRRDRRAAAEAWQILVRNPTVYCRGRVRHQDHATVKLCGWHRVYVNMETEAPGRRELVFLD